ncbi:hypothetical protein NX801_25030 [Streptomyces sp. LP05-1]|uniref:Uncharacterized protein n=1 Tax=Streptomyces pyxinae TaxID=2970734 RepID=A0ABT2CN42_9ACTN|nr:hypothetical protein [Streptomyces sp. LP05-1]MCS0638858.1 hypothetical protein [Streptomyces sp. LP05-1]
MIPVIPEAFVISGPAALSGVPGSRGGGARPGRRPRAGDGPGAGTEDGDTGRMVPDDYRA